MNTTTNKCTKKDLEPKSNSHVNDKMKELEEAFERMEQVKKAANCIKNKKFFS